VHFNISEAKAKALKPILESTAKPMTSSSSECGKATASQR